MPLFIIIVLIALTAVSVHFWLRARRAARADYIRSFAFPPGLFEKLMQKRPGLELKDRQLVARALRQFFLAHLKSGRKFVAMPSQIADDLWHEFILYTRHYQMFCNKAFGRYMHHTPAVALAPGQRDNAGLRRTWWHACVEENINPKKATRLPLLFALDAKLGIADGFVYALNCSVLRRNGDTATHCAGDFSDPAIDGNLDGWGATGTDPGGNWGDSLGSSGGDGGSDGSGCGGGCGGGD